MPQGQDWKSYLVHISRSLGLEDMSDLASTSSKKSRGSKIGFAGSWGVMTRSGQPAAKVQKTRSRAIGTDGMDKLFDVNLTATVIDVHWNGGMVKTSDNLRQGQLELPPHILMQVAWDLYEQNFRLELLALDRSIFLRSKMTVDQEAARDILITDIFPDGLFILYQLPSKDEGLGARDWKSRIVYVEAFRRLLMDWPASPDTDDIALLAEVKLAYDGEKRVRAVECAIFQFYCQTFFDYFGRAPCLPHHLP